MKKYTDFTKKEIEDLEKLSQLNLADLRNISNEQLIDLLRYNFKFQEDDAFYVIKNTKQFDRNIMKAVIYEFEVKLQIIIGCIIHLLKTDISSNNLYDLCPLEMVVYPMAYPVNYLTIEEQLKINPKANPFNLSSESEFNKYTKIQSKLIFTCLERIFFNNQGPKDYISYYAILSFWQHMSDDYSIKFKIRKSSLDDEEECSQEVEEFLKFYHLK